jgi:hypothetical protein
MSSTYKVPRERVFEIISQEREYQEEKVIPGRRFQRNPSLGEFISLLNHYSRKAQDNWTVFSDELQKPPALDIVREIAALAVRCMEHHGAPERVTKEASNLPQGF